MVDVRNPYYDVMHHTSKQKGDVVGPAGDCSVFFVLLRIAVRVGLSWQLDLTVLDQLVGNQVDNLPWHFLSDGWNASHWPRLWHPGGASVAASSSKTLGHGGVPGVYPTSDWSDLGCSM